MSIDFEKTDDALSPLKSRYSHEDWLEIMSAMDDQKIYSYKELEKISVEVFQAALRKRRNEIVHHRARRNNQFLVSDTNSVDMIPSAKFKNKDKQFGKQKSVIFLAFFTPTDYCEAMLGDLEESYNIQVQRLGCNLARKWLWKEALTSVFRLLLDFAITKLASYKRLSK